MNPADPSMPATTTIQQDLTTAGQRKVNLIWEYTQATVALLVVVANMIVWVYTSLKGISAGMPEGLSNSLFLVIGFYFSRTNHQAIGGTGPKPAPPYEGR
jgi:hypothetical protein